VDAQRVVETQNINVKEEATRLIIEVEDETSKVVAKGAHEITIREVVQKTHEEG